MARHLRCLGLLAVVTQAFCFDQVQLDSVVRLCLTGFAEQLRGFGVTSVGNEDIGLSQLRRQVVWAGPDQGVLAQGGGGLAAFFADAAEVEVGGVDIGVPFDKLLQRISSSSGYCCSRLSNSALASLMRSCSTKVRA
ncbi:hypothetical protein WR25_26394 [Diploscapter pachys]|uniref:Secreted protein n=1 Tax=Diploscapter pachys TaxID=2018661 RepID=A0A2A2M5L4_9BILA|nr:hypothetical protein WR25_26394 [Diploscapter pachys]